MNQIEKLINRYERGIYSKSVFLFELMLSINIDDIENELKSLSPEFLIDLREDILLIDWPWKDGQGPFLLGSGGTTPLPPERYEALRNWLQENEDKWIHWV